MRQVFLSRVTKAKPSLQDDWQPVSHIPILELLLQIPPVIDTIGIRVAHSHKKTKIKTKKSGFLKNLKCKYFESIKCFQLRLGMGTSFHL